MAIPRRKVVRVRADADGRMSYGPEPMQQIENDHSIETPGLDLDAIVEALADALVADYRQSRDEEEVA